jgi:molybdenum cofactor synthesis domain-containing protein
VKTDDPTQPRTPDAAIVLIGNELLSGKVVDENGAYLIASLRALGVAVREMRVIPDELASISECVRALSGRFDTVFTSGGVGPTHDDITLEGLARAFEVPLVENATMAQHVQRVFARDEEKRAAFMKMAQVPEGTTLLQSADLLWPLYRIENVYVLPGVPEIFRRQFDAIKERFASRPFFLRTIYFRVDEGLLAPTLTEACREFPSIAIGSYPVLNQPDYRVKVTLESKDRSDVEGGYDWLLARVSAAEVFKVVDGAA